MDDAFGMGVVQGSGGLVQIIGGLFKRQPLFAIRAAQSISQ